jgi:hypothetical protein
LIVILGVASGFVEALGVGVVDVVAGDMAHSNNAVRLNVLSSANPILPSWFDDRWLVVGEIGSGEMSQHRTTQMRIMASK